MKHELIDKLIHYNLDLDYNYCDNIEQQTNILITYIINDFINKYEKDFNSKIFVYEFNDDFISLIGYTILLNIQSIKTNFNFKLSSKPKKTKKFFKRKEKPIKKKELKEKNNKVLISSFNSIYEVIQRKENSKKIVDPDYYLMGKFTPEELICCKKFYGIQDYKGDFSMDTKFLRFWTYLTLETDYRVSEDYILLRNLLSFCGPLNNFKIKLVWLKNNIEDDCKLLQEYEQSDDILLYYFNGKTPLVLKDLNYNLVVKKKTNRVGQNNLNNYKIIKKLKKDQVEFVGNWPPFKKICIEECLKEEDNESSSG